MIEQPESNPARIQSVEARPATGSATESSSSVLEGRGSGTEQALREALNKLRKEVAGALGIAERDIRDAIGNTNVACIKLRLSEADAALAIASSPSSVGTGAGRGVESRSVNEKSDELDAIYAVCLRAGMADPSTALDYVSSVFYAFKQLTDKRESWAVTVERNGDAVVTLASNCLSGRDLIEGDQEIIRTAARNLLGFLGDPSPAHQPDAAPVACYWSLDDVGGDSVWETSCKHAFEFNDGGPNANGMTWCGYCGKPLVEQRTSDADPPASSSPAAREGT